MSPIRDFYNNDIKASWLVQGPKLHFVQNWFLMYNPYPVLAIIVVYLLIVIKLGPLLMRKREPWSMKYFLVFYNAAQVVWSAYLLYLFGELMVDNGYVAKTCGLETKKSQHKIADAMYYYFIAKLIELLETIFLVLRKKSNEVSFLHIYYHVVMVVASWWILKYETTYTSIYFRAINTMFLIIMYIFYFVTSFSSLSKCLWWKKYSTIIQMVLIASILLHFLIVVIISDCRPSFTYSALLILVNSLFLALFSLFYVKTYMNPMKLPVELII